jgi:hypothetical protein
MNSSKTVKANFTPTTYAMAVTPSPTAGGTITGAGNYANGATATLTATAAAGFTFSRWSGSIAGTTNPISVVMNSSKTMIANFTRITYIMAVTPSPSAGGTIITGAGTFISGATTTLTAKAAAGFTFSSWSGSVTGTTNPISVVMNSSKTVTANFTPTTYSMAVAPSPTTGGTITGAPNYLTNGDFSTALNGWETLFMNGAAGSITNDLNSAKVVVTTQGANPYDVQISQGVTLQANHTYTISWDMNASVTPKNFKLVIEHNGTPYTKYYEQQHTVSAAANSWQHFSYTFTPTVDDTQVKLGFHFGTFNTSTVWLDNVTLK